MKDVERKEIKEKLKKKIDEMTDEELDQVAGGGFIPDGFIHFNPDGTITCDKVTTYTCPECGAKLFSEDALGWHIDNVHQFNKKNN